MIGIIGAMEEEVQELIADLAFVKEPYMEKTV